MRLLRLEGQPDRENTNKNTVKRIHYLAAEIFFCSYDNCDRPLDCNARFDRLMPDEARLLDAALDGDFDIKDLGKRLGVDEDEDGVLELLARDC